MSNTPDAPADPSHSTNPTTATTSTTAATATVSVVVPTERHLVVDVARGFLVSVAYLNHTYLYYSAYDYIFGFFTWASCFLFLFGALRYQVFAKRTHQETWIASKKRIFTIYRYFLISNFACMLIYYGSVAIGWDVEQHLKMSINRFISSVFLLHHSNLNNILQLYLFLLFLFPIYSYFIKRNWIVGGTLLSATAWVISPELRFLPVAFATLLPFDMLFIFRTLPVREGFFFWFSWQFLLWISMLCGAYLQKYALQLRHYTNRLSILAGLVGLFLAFMAARYQYFEFSYPYLSRDDPRRMSIGYDQGELSLLHMVNLLVFFLMITVFYLRFHRHGKKILAHRPHLRRISHVFGERLAILGRHALLFYALHAPISMLIYNFTDAIEVKYGADIPIVRFLIAFCRALGYAFIYWIILYVHQRQKNGSSVPAPPVPTHPIPAPPAASL